MQAPVRHVRVENSCAPRARIDSIGELLPLYGSNSNSADEFTMMHTNVLKPLAKAGAAVLAVDHLAKNTDSRAQGPGGTAANRRAIGSVSLRVKVKQPFTPGHGGSALLLVSWSDGQPPHRCPTPSMQSAPSATAAARSANTAPGGYVHGPRYASAKRP